MNVDLRDAKVHPVENWENYDLLRSRIPHFRFLDYTMVQRLVVRNHVGRHGYTCTVELHLGRDYQALPVIVVRFLDACELKIADTHQVCGLEVLDVSHLGWERGRFAVRDYECGAIELFCSSVELDWNEPESPNNEIQPTK
jgi:hypothetical protein